MKQNKLNNRSFVSHLNSFIMSAYIKCFLNHHPQYACIYVCLTSKVQSMVIAEIIL